MSTPKIVTGNDVALGVTLKFNDATFTISPDATVKAVIAAEEGGTKYTDVVTLSSTAPGADWTNSYVVAEFSAAITKSIPKRGHAVVEILVDDVRRQSWFVSVKIIQGNIP